MDRLTTKGAITVATGVLTLTTRLYGNPAAMAAFSAITGTAATVTATVGPSNAYVDFVVVITPDTPVGISAEHSNYVGAYSDPGCGDILSGF